MSLHAEAVKDLAGWTPPDNEQQALRDRYLAHLRAHPDGLSRACRPGHLTASTAVLDPPRRRVLLTLHRKVGRWLQLGGHCEPGDDTLAVAALREATEESGITDLALLDSPVRLDLHAVPCGIAAPITGLLPVAAGATETAGAARASEQAWAAGASEMVGTVRAPGSAGWTWHLDVQFVAISPPGARPIRSDESDDLRWWPVGSLPLSADDAVRRLVARACAVSRWSPR